MKLTVELIDAFVTVEIEIPEQTVTWFTREAVSKGVTIEELLSAKTAGLTVAQLDAAKSAGRNPSAYVLGWILRQPHNTTQRGGIPTAPNEQQNEDATKLGTVPCLKCKAPDVVEGVQHTCPIAL